MEFPSVVPAVTEVCVHHPHLPPHILFPDIILTLTAPKTDLLAFHAKTYGREFDFSNVGFTSLIYGAEAFENYGEEEEDDLGYYPDGVKRTLTDEQIAIFRHSETYTLLEHELALKNQAREDAEERNFKPESIDHDEEEPRRSQAEETLSDADDVDADVDVDNDDDEAEYAAFLAQERQEFSLAAAQRKQQEQHYTGHRDSQPENEHRKISTRRKVREMDAMDSFDQALSYDDDYQDGATGATSRDVVEAGDVKDRAIAAAEGQRGRKIWWPVIENK